MQRLLIATATVAALSLPAMAQQQKTEGMPQYQSSQQQTEGQKLSAHALDESQIKQIQQALDQKGFTPGSVDGKWGPETQAALQKFQQSQQLQSSGELDTQTVAALGLDASEFASDSSGTTTGVGGSSEDSGMSGQSGSSFDQSTSGAGGGASPDGSDTDMDSQKK